MAIDAQSSAMASIGDHWEVEYARFFHFPCLSSSDSLSIFPLTDSTRARLRGTWLSTSSSSISASVKFSADFANSDFVVSVSFLGKVHEEHYISRLNFTWPHVSCMSGFPPRGSRAVFISYKDNLSQIQKFALRFSAISDTEAFMATLKELMEFPKDFGNKSNDKLVSEISSQSDFVPSVASEEVAYRPIEDWNTAITTYKSIDQLESSFNSEVAEKPNLPQSTVLNHDVGNILGGLPPSFMSLMTMSSQAIAEEASRGGSPLRQGGSSVPPWFGTDPPLAARPTPCEQADIKLHLMRYLDNSSFQDIMGKVEEVMSEIGNNTLI